MTKTLQLQNIVDSDDKGYYEIVCGWVIQMTDVMNLLTNGKVSDVRVTTEKA